ncbi:MAG: peptidylprolyl isomerase, partial [Bacteroidota bacterium]|nr:peptidylprolyl isomerase [Bacteroidota bacterium]MDX5431908.1 peptidylprolyl isomerase [Bacteroidota bacterium]MDX5470622.1 peptidylprolyl isomerase [Bacteroidota bacterium]
TKYEIVELSTTYGTMYIWLYDETPKHKANFLKLAKEGFYDGTTFHRCVPGFVIQGGDPLSKDADKTNDGTGGPGYTIPAEIVPSLKHIQGAIGAARQGDNVNPQRASNGSQFYIGLNQNNTAGLDGAYTVFGYVMKGFEVSTTIVSKPFDQKNRPLTDIPMTMKVLSKTKAEIKTEYGYDIP